MPEEMKQAQPMAESSPSPAPTMLEQAEQLAKRIEEANKQTAELLARQEKLQAERLIGGRSEAGTAPAQLDPAVENKNRINTYLKPLGLHI